MSFVHLHVHSHYSLLDGLIKIPELVERAKEYGMTALALTDHGVMYGAIEFYKKCREANIKPIIGAEVYLAPQSRLSKKPRIDDRPNHLILLAKNEEGYKNLVKLITLAHLEGFYYKPRIDEELLRNYHQGLIALSSCLQGAIPKTILTNQPKETERFISVYREIFGDDFYLEVQSHLDSAQEKVNQEIFKLAKKFNLKTVATNDVHYLDPTDAEIQDILLCLQTKKKLTDKDRMKMSSSDFYFRSEEEMAKLFEKTPEVISCTEEVAQKCQLEIELGKIKFPTFPLPEGETPNNYLRKLCQEKVSQRYSKVTAEIKERVEYELGVIEKTGFASYFLIVQDFVSWAKQNDIIVGPGRGSAAGSIVSYVLNITDVDPLKYHLFFERFLNPERISAPDIDLDFTDTRRDEVIRYIEEKYGQNNVAQIITFGTMAARVAVRDVGRVLNLPYLFCDKLAKMIPAHFSLEEALKKVKELRDFYHENSEAKKVIDIAKKLEGSARHASTHACGLVITPKSLNEYLPTQYDVYQNKKVLISQYSMYSIEDLGLLKIDLLGLKNLTILETTLNLIKEGGQNFPPLRQLPLEDKKTFNLLKRGETMSVFQLEGEGMRRCLKELQPNNFEDIIAMIALYRPGPMELIPQYIKGKKGKKITYLHPKLKPILEKTYGVAIYQEQILQIAQSLAGFTLSEADILRKAIGKKIPGLLKEQKNKFIDGCLKNEIQKEIAGKIFNFIEPFAGYAFNRAHATCYATIAYQTAYLKTNYHLEFMTAILISDADNLDKVAEDIEECRKLNIKVLPPDINESEENFNIIKIENKESAVRFGLLAIKNVGENTVKAIISERKENGAFQDLKNFLERTPLPYLNKKSLEGLIKGGALDRFGKRSELLENIETMLEFAKISQKEKNGFQKNLFSLLSSKPTYALKLKIGQTFSAQQLLALEKEFLGLYVSGHPLEEFREEIAKNKEIVSCKELTKFKENELVKIAGVITKIKKIITNSQESMLFVKIEDLTGATEILVFPALLKNTINFWQEGKMLLVKGRISEKDNVLKIIGQDIKELKSSL